MNDEKRVERRSLRHAYVWSQAAAATHINLIRQSLVIVSFFLIATLKFTSLLALGPLWQEDSFAYAYFADAILKGGNWIWHVDLKGFDVTYYRTLGYPVFIAAAKWISPTFWDWLV